MFTLEESKSNKVTSNGFHYARLQRIFLSNFYISLYKT